MISEEGFFYLSLLFFGTLHSDAYVSFFSLLFASLLFTAICKASPDSHFAFLHFFLMGMVLIPVRGSGQEELPHVRGAVAMRVQEGREELLHIQGQEGWW